MNSLNIWNITLQDENIIENFLRNGSFCTLFFSMMFYWIQTASSFTVTPLSPVLPKFTSEEYLGIGSTEGAKAPALAPGIVSSNLLSVGTIAMLLSNFLLMFLLSFRWVESGHFPLSNLYESLMFLSWSCTCIHLILEYKTIFKIARPDANLLTKLIGSITSPSALLTNAFATFSLPLEMQKASPLVPALQSNWLMMHVTVMIISYAALILGSLLSIAFLILINIKVSPPDPRRIQKTKPTLYLLPEDIKQNVEQLVPPQLKSHINSTPPLLSYSEQAELSLSRENVPTISHEAFNLYSVTQVEKLERGMFIGNPTYKQGEPVASFVQNIKKPVTTPLKQNLALLKSNLAWNFDNLSYRVVGIGFPFLTIGILSGAVWANEAWGSYWSWDPKETWALLTWLIFAIYLHARITKGWQGKKPAIIASFGFLAIWICFLGVNLIGEGLHSYGWFS